MNDFINLLNTIFPFAPKFTKGGTASQTPTSTQPQPDLNSSNPSPAVKMTDFTDVNSEVIGGQSPQISSYSKDSMPVNVQRLYELLKQNSANNKTNKVTLNQVQKAVDQATFEAQPENIEEADTEEVEYTYKSGDTFGQVIKDLGMESGHGLWGDDGDVAYYQNQLREQGWNGGNIPIGTTFKLRKRR